MRNNIDMHRHASTCHLVASRNAGTGRDHMACRPKGRLTMTSICYTSASGHPAFACAADGSSNAAVERAAGWICAGSGHGLLQTRVDEYLFHCRRFWSANIEAEKEVESPKSQLPQAANVHAQCNESSRVAYPPSAAYRHCPCQLHCLPHGCDLCWKHLAGMCP